MSLAGFAGQVLDTFGRVDRQPAALDRDSQDSRQHPVGAHHHRGTGTLCTHRGDPCLDGARVNLSHTDPPPHRFDVHPPAVASGGTPRCQEHPVMRDTVGSRRAAQRPARGPEAYRPSKAPLPGRRRPDTTTTSSWSTTPSGTPQQQSPRNRNTLIYKVIPCVPGCARG